MLWVERVPKGYSAGSCRLERECYGGPVGMLRVGVHERVRRGYSGAVGWVGSHRR